MAVRRILFAWPLLLAACAGAFRDAEPPEVALAGVGFGRPGLFEQELRVDLRVRNPNDFDLAVDALEFDLEVNDLPFAEGRTDRGFELDALGEAVVPVTVFVSTTDLMEQVMRLGVEQRLEYQLTGSAELGDLFGYSLPFERTGELALPRLTTAPSRS